MLVVMLLLLPFSTREEGEGIEEKGSVEIAPGIYMPYVSNGFINDAPVNGTNDTNPEEVAGLKRFFKLGGRAVDTAWSYRNQGAVGMAVRDEQTVPRSDLFVTTKIECIGTAEGAYAAIVYDLKRLGLPYVDLVLIHAPYLGYGEPWSNCSKGAAGAAARQATWKGMEKAVHDGLTRAIGVSNFDVEYLDQVLQTAKIKPSVNQCCFTVGNQDNATIDFGNKHGITYQAYSPLGGSDSGGKSILDLPVLKAIAANHANKSTAQIAFRWLVQQKSPFVTATGRRDYILEDLDIFDFELSQGEMARLNSVHHFEGLAPWCYLRGESTVPTVSKIQPEVEHPYGSLPPGGSPFGSAILGQPVAGAPRGVAEDGWKHGRLCNVAMPPYSAKEGSNATAELQQAINDCGGLENGGTVLVPAGLHLQTASLWLLSNLTLRVEGTLTSTATGTGASGTTSIEDAPLVYTRRNSLMVTAHAGMINGGKCLRMKAVPSGGDDCEEWQKLTNVVIEGGGLIDGDGDDWYKIYGFQNPALKNLRPMLLDLLWIDGLTVRNLTITRPGYWTVHPTFCNNVAVVGNTINTWNVYHAGSNTDGVDPDSTWNVYIADNSFSTGDDCIAIKAGRDWSGRMVNISTQNVLAENNLFLKGHGVSIGSETSGWVRNITIRNSTLHGADLAVRIKTDRGRGGGVEDVLFENLAGITEAGIQLTLQYTPNLAPTNASATPTIRRITLRNISIVTENCTGSAVGKVCALSCEGLPDSIIEDVVFDGVAVTGNADGQQCHACNIQTFGSVVPTPKCS